MKRYLYILSLLMMSTVAFVSCSYDEWTDPVSTEVPEKSFIVKDTVKVKFTDGGAAVDIPVGRNDVSCEINGGFVTLNNTNETDELVFVLSGSSTNGGLIYNGAFKCTMIIDNLSLVSSQGPAIDIQCGKRIAVRLTEGSVNYLEDAAGGTHKGCLYCRGHIQLSGNGELTVKGNTANGIHVKEYLHVSKSFGTLNISETVGHAVKVGEEVEIQGGTFNLTVNNEDTKALNTDSTLTISGGTFNVVANGDGTRGLQANYDIEINENDGPTNIIVEANGGKCSDENEHRCMGIKTDLVFKMSAGYVKVTKLKNSARGIRCLSKELTGGTCDAEFKEGL